MSLNENSPKKLLEFLEKLITGLKKKGTLPLAVNSKALAQQVSDKLKAAGVELNLDNLMNDPDMVKSLEFSCVLTFDPNNNFDISILFKPLNQTSPEYLKENIKQIFPELVMLNPELKPEEKEENKKKQEQEISPELEGTKADLKEKLNIFLDKVFNNTNEDKQKTVLFAALLINNIKCKMTTSKKSSALNVDEQAASEHRKEIFGIDTTLEGGLAGVVQSATLGPNGNIEVTNVQEQGRGESLAADFLNSFFNKEPQQILGGVKTSLKEHDIFIEHVIKNTLIK